MNLKIIQNYNKNMIPDIKEIKVNRMLLGLTQKELAQTTGISQSIIAKIESHKVSPSYDIIKRLFEKFEELKHKTEKSCLDIMNKNLISIESNESVKTAANIMKTKSISQMPVFDKKRLVGNKIKIQLNKEELANRLNNVLKFKIAKRAKRNGDGSRDIHTK